MRQTVHLQTLSRSFGSLALSLTSLLHTLILSLSLLRDRHTHCLQLHSVPCYPQIVVLFPPSRLYFLRGQSSPGTSLVSPGSTPMRSQHISHTPTPTCTYPFIDQYHLYNTVHYKEKKISLLPCTSSSGHPYMRPSA